MKIYLKIYSIELKAASEIFHLTQQNDAIEKKLCRKEKNQINPTMVPCFTKLLNTNIVFGCTITT